MPKGKLERATLGGGCFWCVEAAFEQLEGVEEVESGYTGGDVQDPTYEQVCSGQTGHAEVVRIGYDPERISFRDLLDVFFTVHDPTTLNRQGADVGTQYRSAIFVHDDEQERVAREAIRAWESSGAWNGRFVTEIAPAPRFYPAEEYHREYYRRNPDQPYCQAVIAPKLAKLRQEHFGRLARRDPDSPQVRPYQGAPANPIDHGGISD